jgi:hypothetical protein
VECVLAQRERPEEVVAGELAQVGHTIELLLGAGAHHLLDDTLVQPGVMQVEQLLQLSLQR